MPSSQSDSPVFTERELDVLYDALEDYEPSAYMNVTEDEVERMIAKIVPPYERASQDGSRRTATTPLNDAIVQACVDNGGHFWPDDAPEDEPPTCTRCWLNPGWKAGRPRNEHSVRPIRDEPQA